jgi:hypothetical protein
MRYRHHRVAWILAYAGGAAVPKLQDAGRAKILHTKPPGPWRKVPGMDSRDLSKEQCDWLYKQLSEMAHRLCLIRDRMKDRGFPQDDKMYRLACGAYNAVWTANQHAHALSCQGKMGATYFFVGDDGIGRTKPSNESPQPHDQSQHHCNQRRGE